MTDDESNSPASGSTLRHSSCVIEVSAALIFRRGRLLMLAMRLNGLPLAGRCSFLAGDGSFAFKTAFDEQHAQSSPGILMELENIRRVHDMPAVRWMVRGARLADTPLIQASIDPCYSCTDR